MPPLKTKQQLAKEQKASNARERQIAKQYLQSGPSIQNLYNALTHWYNSVPFLGGQPENGLYYWTGEAPNPSMRDAKSIISGTKALDDLYENAVKLGDRKTALKLLDQAYNKAVKIKNSLTHNKNGEPKIWYHGSEHGNHTVFDSSKFNATIGGESAAGKIKGNFLTTDAPSAARYAGYAVGQEGLPLYTTPQGFVEKMQNFLKMYKKQPLHGSDVVAGMRPKPARLGYKPKGRGGVVENLDNTDRVVYPLYVNPGKTYTVDFKGQPWSKSPVEMPNQFSVHKYIRDDINRTYRDEVVPFRTKEEAVDYYYSLKDRFGKQYVEPVHKIDDKYFPYSGGDREVEMFASAPTYEKARLIETHVPNTSNGVVQTAARQGYDSAYMPNIIDSNTKHYTNPYAIDDLVLLNSNQMKLADITYDNAGNLIPLSKRFNWDIDDIRYGLVPVTVGGIGYGLYNTYDR